MSDYTPGWHFVFPEPHEDARPFRSTGPRRELGICRECGREIEHPSSFDATCGDDKCRAQAAGRSQR